MGLSLIHCLLDQIVGIRLGGDLSQMGDANDLMGSSDDSHLLGYFLSRSAADPHIDLIEDQGGDLIFICHHSLDGQHDPGQLTAGSDFSQRLQGFTGIHGDHVGDVILSVCRVLRQTGKIDLEPHIRKIQILKSLCDLLGKEKALLLSESCQYCCVLLQMLESTLIFLLQFLKIAVIIIQDKETALFLLTVRPDLLYRTAVLCLESVDLIEPVLSLCKIFVRKVKRLFVVCKLSVEIIQKAVHFQKLVVQFLCSFIQTCCFGKTSDGAAQRLACAIPIFAGVAVGFMDALHDLSAVDHAPVALFQLLVLSVLQSRLLDLPYFKFQEGSLFGPRGLILICFLQLFFPLLVLLERDEDFLFCLQDLFRGKGIQDLQLSLLVEERLVLVLSMDVDQDPCRLLQKRDGHRLPVDLAGAAPLHEPPAQDNSPLLRENIQLFQSLFLLFIFNSKGQFHKSILRSFPQDVRGISGPKSETDRTEDDGFPRSGLPCQYIQPLLEVNLHLVDQGEIFHM